jgi:hypothetical protein
VRKNKLTILAVISILILVQLACGVAINTGAGQNTIPAETSIAMTLASLPGSKPANPQAVEVNNPNSSPNTSSCNRAKLVSETVADGTSMSINTNFNKTWRIMNTGTCTWNTNYRIGFHSGESMSGPASMNFSKNVAPGETIDFILPLKAPATIGTYTGNWQLFGDDNAIFPQTPEFWVTINTVNSTPPQENPNPTVPENTLAPSPTPLPCNKPKMINETIPDNKTYAPNTNFVKSWTIRNDGTCIWDSSYRFIFMGGTQMGGLSSMSLPKVVAPGDSVTLSVSLKAPSTDGAYTGTWVLKSGSGEMFGNYWAKIIVGLPTGPFAVTSVKFFYSNIDNSGSVPAFDMNATITVNGPGTVTYIWKHADGAESKGSITFNTAGTKTIVDGGWGRRYCEGGYNWVELYIDKPNHQSFGKACN